MLNKEQILSKTQLNEVICFDTIDSTNTYLKNLAKSDFNKDRILVIAGEQSAGRGRMNKSFYSPKDGLYLSLLYRYPISIDKAQLITIVTAIVLKESIEYLYHIAIDIKWLNDLFIEGRKLCGILSEGVISSNEYYDFIVIGIGINIKTPNVLPIELKDIIIALDEKIDFFDETEFIINFVNKLDNYMQHLEDEIDSILDKYRKSCITLNQTIYLTGSKEALYVYDINELGHLVARDDLGRTHYLNSGEVRIKK